MPGGEEDVVFEVGGGDVGDFAAEGLDGGLDGWCEGDGGEDCEGAGGEFDCFCLLAVNAARGREREREVDGAY